MLQDEMCTRLYQPQQFFSESGRELGSGLVSEGDVDLEVVGGVSSEMGK